MRTLDRTRPFAEIFPPGPEEGAFQQDGIRFDFAGKELGAKPEPGDEDEPELVQEPPPPEPKPARRDIPALSEVNVYTVGWSALRAIARREGITDVLSYKRKDLEAKLEALRHERYGANPPEGL